MTEKRFTAEQIIIKLREAEVGLAQGSCSNAPLRNHARWWVRRRYFRSIPELVQAPQRLALELAA